MRLIATNNKSSNKLRIIILSAIYYPDHLGGAEISTQILAESLRRDYDYDITLLCNSSNKTSSVDIVNGISVIRHAFPYGWVHFIPTDSNMRLSVSDKVKRKLYTYVPLRDACNFYRGILAGFDLCIVSGNAVEMCHLACWRVARELGVPVIHIIRDPSFLYYKGYREKPRIIDRLHQRLVSRGVEQLDAIAAPSKAIIKAHIDRGMQLPSRVEVIPNPIDYSACASLPFSDKSQSVLYVGTISKIKGIDTLVRACEILGPELCCLDLVGKLGKTEVESPMARLHGHLSLEETYAAMAKAKVLVLPSIWEEAFGRVLVESVFNGTVCIGSDAGGIPEVLGYDDRFIFHAGSPYELTEKLRVVLTADEGEYASMLASQQRVMKRYMPEVVAAQWDVILRASAGQSGIACQKNQ